jgi:hypothetical protein
MKRAHTYSRQESEQIFKSYQALWPNIPPQLEKFLDVNKERPWSVLTSDFHTTFYVNLQTFHQSLGAVDYSTKPSELGIALAALSRAHNTGFSHGFSPWTDAMLLETFSSKTRRLLIILGHDWYPIVTHDYDPTAKKGYAALSPLIHQSPRDEYPHALPDSLTAHPDRAILFLNLFPDFRPPCTDCMGDIGGMHLSLPSPPAVAHWRRLIPSTP